jgi:hypothetical protein
VIRCLTALLVVLASASVAVGSQARPNDASAVRGHLRDILSRPEYNRTFGDNAVQQFWLRVWDKVLEALSWLGKLFSFGGGTAGRIASLVFACLVIALFLALMLFLIRRLLAVAAREKDDVASVDEHYDLPSAGPLIRQAEKLAQSGDFRGAFGCAYLASISYLDEVKALRFERSRTNWEYLRELDHGGHTAARDELHPLTLDFDRKFYGREECTRQDYERALAAFGRIADTQAGAT